MGRAQKKTGGNLGSRFQYRFFEGMVRCRALALARVALAVVVLYYTLLPRVRRRCAPYLERRFADAGAWRMFFHAYRLYLSFGQVLLDRMVAGSTGRFPLCSTDPEVRRKLVEAGRNPKGCIVLTAHIGAWQVGLAGLEQFDKAVHILQQYSPDDPDKHYFERGKGKPLHIIDSSDPVGSLVEVAAVLRRGEMVCFMGDRLMAGSHAARSVIVPFLGGRIRVPAAVYALASITGADLIMLFTVREKGITRALSAERIVVPPGLPRQDLSVFLPYARRFAQGMESIVEQYPYQFFNFYDMWL